MPLWFCVVVSPAADVASELLGLLLFASFLGSTGLVGGLLAGVSPPEIFVGMSVVPQAAMRELVASKKILLFIECNPQFKFVRFRVNSTLFCWKFKYPFSCHCD